jgi:hypothetical protein
LQSFISENFWHLRNEVFLNHRPDPLNAWVSDDVKNQLSEALSIDPIFAPKDELTLFPLIPVVVREGFRSKAFFFSSADADNPFNIDDEIVLQNLDAKRFPPLRDFNGAARNPPSWLGVYSPDPKAALKTRSSILGALALTSLPHHRHMFSGREVFGGVCTIKSGGTSHSFKHKHTPPCMYDIVITELDASWLSILAEKLASPDKGVQRQLKALEYFYRAWSKEPAERFPILCMALDAIFGDANSATQAVIDGIREALGEHISDPQLRLLMGLRASVVHGGAPDVYDSSKYAKYYKTYQADPISELDLVVSACLKKLIFDDHLIVHRDPNEQVIKEAQAKGRFPKNRTHRSILTNQNQLVGN